MPRPTRSLRGWNIASPQFQRLPMPVEMLGAVMGIFLHWGFHQLAFRLFLEFVGYMRPGECSNLKVSQLIPPQPSMTSARHFWAILLHPQELKVPGKTAVLDVSILIDSDLWMGQYLSRLSSKKPTDHLWDQPHTTLLNKFSLVYSVYI